MQTLNKIKLICLSVLSLGFINAASAGVIVTAPTANDTGSIEITADITFAVTNAGTLSVFVFDEWVATPDAARNFVNLSPLSISYNGNTPVTVSGGSVSDNRVNGGMITSNDGYITLNSGGAAVVPGDTVTLKVGTYTLAKNANFNPATSQMFVGNMFIGNNSSTRMSDAVAIPAVVVVPEPTTYALLGIGAIALGFSRRRFGKA